MDAWNNAQKSQKILIIAVIVLTIIAISVVVSMTNQVEYGVLFSGLSNEDAGKVAQELEAQGIEYKTGPDGTLLVPREEAEALKYKLQADGLITGDALDYSIYSGNASAFGATDKDKKYYETVQKQQNISQTINRMDKIKSSIVMLNIVDPSQYVLSAADNQQSTASVMITLKNSQMQLSESDVAAIRAIVSKAVPDLSDANISIVDQNMRSYSVAGDLAAGTSSVDTQLALQNKVASDLQQQIVTLLTPVFGAENISAQVRVTLDFDKKTTNSLTLSPPTRGADNTGIVTSMEMTAERLMGTNEVAQGAVGMDPNGGGPTYEQIDTAAGDSKYYNAVTKVNYEVNEISQQIEEAQGDITAISTSVILNGGEELAGVLEEVRTIISDAAGIPEGSITVSSMPFEGTAAYQQMIDEQTKQLEAQQQQAFIQSLIVPIAVVAGIVIILLILLSSFKKKRQAELEAQRAQAEAEAEALRAAGLSAGGVDVVADEEISIEDLLKEKNDNMLKQVQMLVDKNPEVIAQLLRNWLTDDIGGGRE